MDNFTKRSFEGMESPEAIRQGDYIVSIFDENNIIWFASSRSFPICDLSKSTIFQTDTAGAAKVQTSQDGDDLFFNILGVKVHKVYDHTGAGEWV